MAKRKYGTCEAKIQDEFPGWADENGERVGGSITQLELTSPSDAGEVVAWFSDPALAELVARLLNKGCGGDRAIRKHLKKITRV